jgi:hypothetical protein
MKWTNFGTQFVGSQYIDFTCHDLGFPFKGIKPEVITIVVFEYLWGGARLH